MAKVTVIRPDETQIALDLEPGLSVMQLAISSGEDGIVAECGGSLMCATCHVFVESADGSWPGRSAEEEEMLACTAVEMQDNSRLSCQLVASEDSLDLVVRLPDAQL